MLLRLGILCGLIPFIAQVHGQNCSVEALNKDETMSNELRYSNAEKMERMRTILGEIQSLETLRRAPKDLPKSFYDRCYKKKIQAFSLFKGRANEQMSDQAEFHALLGQYLKMMGRQEDALKAYDHAATKDPRNSEYKMRAVELFLNVEERRIKSLPTKQDVLRAQENFKRKTITRLDDILKTPDITNKIRAHANVYKGIALMADSRNGEAEAAFIAGLNAEPRNKLLLKHIVIFYEQTHQTEKLLPHLKKLSSLEPNMKTFETWAESAWSLEKMPEVLEAANAGLQIDKNSIELLAYRAGALFRLGRQEEAAALNRDLMKKNSENSVVKKTQSLVLEDRADKLGTTQPGQALALYKEALKLDRSRATLNEKMARLIYQYAKSKNFKPESATKTDFDYALEILKPQILSEFGLSNELQTIVIVMFQHSTNPAQGVALCKTYEEKKRGFESNLDVLIGCAHIFKSAGQKTKAQFILNSGMNSANFSEQRSVLMDALKTIGL